MRGDFFEALFADDQFDVAKLGADISGGFGVGYANDFRFISGDLFGQSGDIGSD